MRTYFETFERDNGTEVTVEYTISNYDPGVSSGPAESCYPPEGGEVEIIRVFDDTGNINATDLEHDKWSTWIAENHVFEDEQDYFDD